MLNKLNRYNLFYPMFRIALAIPLLLQYSKIIDIFSGNNDSFSEYFLGTFSNSFLPSWALVSYSYLLPMGQFIAGIMLFFGIYTRLAATGAVLVCATLLFGVVLAGPSMTLWVAKMLAYILCYYIIAKDNDEAELFSITAYFNRKKVK